jgi:hypothetical protein
MKKESNIGLFFLLALGIVGLGLYYGATEDYGQGEIQLYHALCWIILIIAFIRVLELVWKPLKELWEQVWGKADKAGWQSPGYKNQAAGYGKPGASMPDPERTEAYAKEAPKEYERALFEGQEKPVFQEYHKEPQDVYEKEPQETYAKSDMPEGFFVNGRGERVIIMPDGGARFYLKDKQRDGKEPHWEEEYEDVSGREVFYPVSEEKEKNKKKNKKKKKD